MFPHFVAFKFQATNQYALTPLSLQQHSVLLVWPRLSFEFLGFTLFRDWSSHEEFCTLREFLQSYTIVLLICFLFCFSKFRRLDGKLGQTLFDNLLSFMGHMESSRYIIL